MWRALLPRSLPRGAERLGGDSHGVGRAACGPADNSLRTFGAECKSPERRVGDKKISRGRGGKSECVEREDDAVVKARGEVAEQIIERDCVMLSETDLLNVRPTALQH